MTAIELVPANRDLIHARLADGSVVVACLCAAWCDVCTTFREGFDRLAADHADKLFLWIDIEDEAEVVGDFDVDNFPTLLIERHGQIAFFGSVEADPATLKRLIDAQVRALPASGVRTPSTGANLLNALAGVIGN